jgi:hypothetical protein
MSGGLNCISRRLCITWSIFIIRSNVYLITIFFFREHKGKVLQTAPFLLLFVPHGFLLISRPLIPYDCFVFGNGKFRIKSVGLLFILAAGGCENEPHRPCKQEEEQRIDKHLFPFLYLLRGKLFFRLFFFFCFGNVLFVFAAFIFTTHN